MKGSTRSCGLRVRLDGLFLRRGICDRVVSIAFWILVAVVSGEIEL